MCLFDAINQFLDAERTINGWQNIHWSTALDFTADENRKARRQNKS